jgi:hypothetical protein
MEASRKKFGLVFVRMLIGGVVGFAAMKFGLEGGLGPMLRGAGPGSAALAGFGLIYGLMGLFVGIGVAARRWVPRCSTSADVRISRTSGPR